MFSEYSLLEISALARSGKSTRRELKQKIADAQLSEVRKYDLLSQHHLARRNNVFPNLKEDIRQGKTFEAFLAIKALGSFVNFIYQSNRAFYDLNHSRRLSRQARRTNQ